MVKLKENKRMNKTCILAGAEGISAKVLHIKTIRVS